MPAVCKTWSIAGDKRITGLCSMEMLLETARTMRDGCPICATPVVPLNPESDFSSSSSSSTGITSVVLTSGNDLSGLPSNTDHTHTIAANGSVTFDWSYVSSDIAATYDPFGYLVDGVFVQLSVDAGGLTQSGTETVSLLAGQVFGWRQRTIDNEGGSATTTITYTP